MLLAFYVGLNIILGVAIVYTRNNILYISTFIAIMIVLEIILHYKINKPIKYLNNILGEIIGGQLNVSIKRTKIKSIDQFGDKVNGYLERIRKIIGDYANTSEITDKETDVMKAQTENLKVTASEIASTTQNISETANNQALYAGEINKSMEDFSRGVEEVFKNSLLSVEVAKDSKITVERSFNTFKQTFNKIEEIKNYNDEVLSDIVKLDKAIRQITAITEAVEGIASETHLLSLNASIEAARAGETGRGFAVVAGEVSKLAANSSDSAKEIKELVNNITVGIAQLTSNINVQTDVIEDNIASANKALAQSDVIGTAVEENRKAAEKIAALTGKQKNNIEGIKHAIEVINDWTQQNAAVTEEITASTQEQLSIIEIMHSSVASLDDAIKHSNDIMDKFTAGFKITEDIKNKIEETKVLVEELAKSEELINLKGIELQDHLMKKQNSKKFIEFIAVVNNFGWITDSSIEIPDTEIDRQCSSRLYFKEAILGKQFESKEYISIITGNYNITISMPTYKDGNINGIVFADINLND